MKLNGGGLKATATCNKSIFNSDKLKMDCICFKGHGHDFHIFYILYEKKNFKKKIAVFKSK